MNDPIWKLYYRFGQTVADAVTRTWPDGKQESCLVTEPEYLKWLAKGNTPEPADPVPVIVKTPTLVEQILASPADLAALKQALGL